MSQYLDTPILFDNNYGFLKENNSFLNNLMTKFYKENLDY